MLGLADIMQPVLLPQIQDVLAELKQEELDFKISFDAADKEFIRKRRSHLLAAEMRFEGINRVNSCTFEKHDKMWWSYDRSLLRVSCKPGRAIDQEQA